MDLSRAVPGLRRRRAATAGRMRAKAGLHPTMEQMAIGPVPRSRWRMAEQRHVKNKNKCRKPKKANSKSPKT
tara:strand:+ start:35 stop:250 length:216 start_codon:yes stop_codon:yes gene_type:complete